jgi:hypothetical protein
LSKLKDLPSLRHFGDLEIVDEKRMIDLRTKFCSLSAEYGYLRSTDWALVKVAKKRKGDSICQTLVVSVRRQTLVVNVRR